MSDYLAQIDELLDQIYDLDDNLTKVSLLEAAIKIADTHQDIETGFELRDDLIHTLYYCGYPEKLLAAFSWCLAQCDRNPTKFAEQDLLWEYKWIAEALPHFPQISRQQLSQTFADMKTRYQRTGKSLRAVYQHQCMAAILMGDHELAATYFPQWQNAPEGYPKDCAGSELDLKIDYLLFNGQAEQAIADAQPIIKGRLKCDELPHLTQSRLLIPLVKLQRLETAASYHLQSYRKIANIGKYLEQVAQHLLFLTLTKNFGKAVSVMETNFKLALTTTAISDRFYFYRSSYFLFSQLQEDGQQNIGLRLPKNLPNYSSSGNYQVSELLNQFKQETSALAQQFNRRNQNSYYSEKIIELTELNQYLVEFPLSSNYDSKPDSQVDLNQGGIFDAL